MFFSCGACLIIQVQAALTVRQFSMFINENSDFQKSGGGGGLGEQTQRCMLSNELETVNNSLMLVKLPLKSKCVSISLNKDFIAHISRCC